MQKEKKKQKAGLNAVRPDGFIEEKFKTMAKDNRLSQTEMFNRIFLSYLRDVRYEGRKEALNCESEINLISTNLNNILQHIKSIAEKAQDKIISISNNGEQAKNNLSTDLDTANKKIEFLENRNKELEKSNEIFTELKENMTKNITDLKEVLAKSEGECRTLKEDNKSKDKLIHEMEKQIELKDKLFAEMKKEKERAEEEKALTQAKAHNLESANSSLQETINNMETAKKAEISAIDARWQAINAELREQLNTTRETQGTAIKEAVERTRIEMEAEKKLALADLKIELAASKEKLAETLSSVKNKKNARD